MQKSDEINTMVVNASSPLTISTNSSIFTTIPQKGTFQIHHNWITTKNPLYPLSVFRNSSNLLHKNVISQKGTFQICHNWINTKNFVSICTNSSNLLHSNVIPLKGKLQICRNWISTNNAQNPVSIITNSSNLVHSNVIPLKGKLQICRNSINTKSALYPVSIFRNSSNLVLKSVISRKGKFLICGASEDSEGSVSEVGEKIEGEKWEWATSILLFLLWGGLLYYVFNLAPNQTPSRDMYFLEKLLNLKGDDGFRMNQVLVSLWYIMGLWPLTYSMLLLPTARSSKSKIPLWPFLILSCFGGAYALIPYFVLWKPPAPSMEESELGRWPLNFLESKITAAISLAAGSALIIYAGLATGADWKEFVQYFSESKFIHATSIDFTLLSTFAPFWVYNDMTARKWYDKGSWLIPLSLIPFFGPSLYILLRPSLVPEPVTFKPSSSED